MQDFGAGGIVFADMAKPLPDALALRDIKYGEKSTDQARIQTGEQLLAAGRLAEALDLFLIAGHEPGIAGLHERTVAEGRSALLIDAERRGRVVEVEDWKRAGHAALKAGRWREAYRCFHRAEDEDGLNAVREHLPDYEIYVPQGK